MYCCDISTLTPKAAARITDWCQPINQLTRKDRENADAQRQTLLNTKSL